MYSTIQRRGRELLRGDIIVPGLGPQPCKNRPKTIQNQNQNQKLGSKFGTPFHPMVSNLIESPIKIAKVYQSLGYVNSRFVRIRGYTGSFLAG